MEVGLGGQPQPRPVDGVLATWHVAGDFDDGQDVAVIKTRLSCGDLLRRAARQITSVPQSNGSVVAPKMWFTLGQATVLVSYLCAFGEARSCPSGRCINDRCLSHLRSYGSGGIGACETYMASSTIYAPLSQCTNSAKISSACSCLTASTTTTLPATSTTKPVSGVTSGSASSSTRSSSVVSSTKTSSVPSSTVSMSNTTTLKSSAVTSSSSSSPGVVSSSTSESTVASRSSSTTTSSQSNSVVSSTTSGSTSSVSKSSSITTLSTSRASGSSSETTSGSVSSSKSISTTSSPSGSSSASSSNSATTSSKASSSSTSSTSVSSSTTGGSAVSSTNSRPSTTVSSTTSSSPSPSSTTSASMTSLATTHTTSTSSTPSPSCGTPENNPFWIDQIKHQGVAAFNTNSSYQVYRNVKCYGAKGDGVTDDTAAINRAITDGNRCYSATNCKSQTTTPAYVYFPSGTYIVSGPINAIYNTQLVGNPSNYPTIQGTSNFVGLALIDANPYTSNGQYYDATNNFFRSVRNFVLDIRAMPALPNGQVGTGIHWQVAQATSLQNIEFIMSTASDTKQQGIYSENGSGGFMTDLIFQGGKYGMYWGSQQTTIHNARFSSQTTAGVVLTFAWGTTFQGCSWNNLPLGIDMALTDGNMAQSTSSIVVVDSVFQNLNVGINTARTQASSSPPAAGALVLDNVIGTMVNTMVTGRTAGTAYNPNPNSYSGALTNEPGNAARTSYDYYQGRLYSPSNHGINGQGSLGNAGPKLARPASLVDGAGNYQMKSKPQYENLAATDFISVRDYGAKGNGVTDDTAALQSAFNAASTSGKHLFVDNGVYRVTHTLQIPANIPAVVGEAWPRFMADGSSPTFSSMRFPSAMLQVGDPGGAVGSIEISDIVVQVKGNAAGAILLQWNVHGFTSSLPGLWDVHANVGGTAGTNLQYPQCDKNAALSNLENACIGAFMLMQIGPNAANVYMENNWLWTADHELDTPGQNQIDIFTGRGLQISTGQGNTGSYWLYGTAVEHNIMYNYYLSGAKNLFAGLIQTETPYFQAPPAAPIPFVTNANYNDPDFNTICATAPNKDTCAKAYGLLVRNSAGIRIAGAGLYSFFGDNYSQTCISSNTCQDTIFALTGTTDFEIYTLNTIGSTSMAVKDGTVLATAADNVGTFPDTIAYLQPY